MMKAIRTLASAAWYRLPGSRRAKELSADACGLEGASRETESAEPRDQKSRGTKRSSSRVEASPDYQALIGVF